MLFYSINSFSSRPFRSSPSIVSAVLVDCFCCSSRPFRFSPSIVSALLVDRSASVRRLFMLFSSINRFSSRQFRSSSSITSALLLMDVGGVRRKMACKNCEHINAVKTVNDYVFLNVGTP